MSLFEVPGWSVPSAPVRDDTRQVSKKRKRPGSEANKLDAAEMNVEKLMAKLASAKPESGPLKPKIGPRKLDQAGAAPAKKKFKQNQTRSPVVLVHSETPGQDASQSRTTARKANKNFKPKQASPDKPSKAVHVSDSKPTASNPCLTTLQKSMKESLDGARFRLINENLYKSDSHEAHKMMREDPKVFEEYHTGFRHQVLSWPTNPVEHYVSKFASYPQRTIIADLGCGDAALAKGLLSKGISVISFDLVSDEKFVVEADICERIPLPGSEDPSDKKSTGEGQVVDIVVCALSLMGVNWVQCVREAWRILKAGGQLHIAEVTSRFSDIEQFESLVGSIGFRLKEKDDSNTHFVLFEFTKVPRTSKSEKEWTKLLSRGAILKPCEYKRR